jgi:hypothetical protein
MHVEEWTTDALLAGAYSGKFPQLVLLLLSFGGAFGSKRQLQLLHACDLQQTAVQLDVWHFTLQEADRPTWACY